MLSVVNVLRSLRKAVREPVDRIVYGDPRELANASNWLAGNPHSSYRQGEFLDAVQQAIVARQGANAAAHILPDDSDALSHTLAVNLLSALSDPKHGKSSLGDMLNLLGGLEERARQEGQADTAEVLQRTHDVLARVWHTDPESGVAPTQVRHEDVVLKRELLEEVARTSRP